MQLNIVIYSFFLIDMEVVLVVESVYESWWVYTNHCVRTRINCTIYYYRSIVCLTLYAIIICITL